jgi:hypothetical protein
VIQAIHQNGVNQKVTTLTDPTYPVNPGAVAASNSAQTLYTIDPHFHAATDLQAAVGIDRQLAKKITANITYLYGRGVHQYYTNNIGAPNFSTAFLGIYPAEEPPPAEENDLQYQSGGVYRQNQIIVSGRASYPRFSFFTFYTYNAAKADTSGVTYTPSVAQNPGLDYGRSSFDVHDRFVILGNFSAPWGVSLTPFFAYNSGAPYNVTVGADLTRNNQFNARPAFAPSSDCSIPVATGTTPRYYYGRKDYPLRGRDRPVECQLEYASEQSDWDGPQGGRQPCCAEWWWRGASRRRRRTRPRRLERESWWSRKIRSGDFAEVQPDAHRLRNQHLEPREPGSAERDSDVAAFQ